MPAVLHERQLYHIFQTGQIHDLVRMHAILAGVTRGSYTQDPVDRTGRQDGGEWEGEEEGDEERVGEGEDEGAGGRLVQGEDFKVFSLKP